MRSPRRVRWSHSTAVSVLAVLVLAAVPSAGSARAETIDGRFDGTGRITGGTTVEFEVLGRGGVPANGVDSVALNVTVTRAGPSGYVTVWPTGRPRPLASNLNFVRGQTVPNTVIVGVGDDGRVSMYSNGAGGLDVVVDVLGWFPTGAGFTGLTPARLLDTRADGGTVDGVAVGQGAMTGGSTLEVPVAGRSGVPANGTGSVALNVTVTNPTADAYLTVWPAGQQRPVASSVNVVAGATVPNMVLVPLGTDGRVSMFVNAGAADLVVDVLGWFPADGAFRGLTPARLMDTRSTASGYVPILGGVFSRAMVSDGESIWIPDDTGVIRFHIGSEVSERVVLPGFEFGGDLLIDGDQLWITRLDQIGRLDVRTGELRVFGPTWGANGLGDPVLLGSAVWTMNRGSNSISRFDRRTGATRIFPLPDWTAGASGMTTDGRYLWFPSAYANAFFRFDPATGAIVTHPLPAGLQAPLFATFDGRRVWTSRRMVGDGILRWCALTSLDVITGEIRDVDLSTAAGAVMDLAADGTSVWASREDLTHLTQVDPSSGSVTVVPMSGDVATASFGDWWFGSVAVDADHVWLGTSGALAYRVVDR